MIIFTKTEDYGQGPETKTATINPTNLGAIQRLERDGWTRQEE